MCDALAALNEQSEILEREILNFVTEMKPLSLDDFNQRDYGEDRETLFQTIAQQHEQLKNERKVILANNFENSQDPPTLYKEFSKKFDQIKECRIEDQVQAYVDALVALTRQIFNLFEHATKLIKHALPFAKIFQIPFLEKCLLKKPREFFLHIVDFSSKFRLFKRELETILSYICFLESEPKMLEKEIWHLCGETNLCILDLVTNSLCDFAVLTGCFESKYSFVLGLKFSFLPFCFRF